MELRFVRLGKTEFFVRCFFSPNFGEISFCFYFLVKFKKKIFVVGGSGCLPLLFYQGAVRRLHKIVCLLLLLGFPFLVVELRPLFFLVDKLIALMAIFFSPGP